MRAGLSQALSNDDTFDDSEKTSASGSTALALADSNFYLCLCFVFFRLGVVYLFRTYLALVYFCSDEG